MSAEKIDDTPVPVLQPGRKHTKLARLWGYIQSRGAGRVVRLQPGSQGQMAPRTGQLQVAGYNPLYETGQVHEVACWAHVRRMFVDIAERQSNCRWRRSNGSPACMAWPEANRPSEKRFQARAGPLLKTMAPRRTRQDAEEIGAGQCHPLCTHRYVNDGRLEIDNKREIRPSRSAGKIGCSGSAGGERAAAFYSL